jgi:hypothetical protein
MRFTYDKSGQGDCALCSNMHVAALLVRLVAFRLSQILKDLLENLQVNRIAAFYLRETLPICLGADTPDCFRFTSWGKR